MESLTHKGRRPNSNSIRAKLILYFAENPTAMLTRQDVCDLFGVTVHGIEHAVTTLKRDGHIKSLYGPNRTYYYLKGDSPVVKLPKTPRARNDPKVTRRWPEGSYYVEPRPIPISVFEWRP